MSKNVYDIFRTVSKKRTACFDTRSAAFITQGKLSKDIYHKRKQKTIKAGLVYQYKEGPDEAIVYTFKKDDLRKGDYFIFDHVNYLVYEDQKLTDENNNHKKHRAVECNVSFSFEGECYKGYFVSTMRRKSDPDLEGKQILMPDEMPLLMLPKNSKLTINSIFVIDDDDKPWKVVEYDAITNRGITYYYLERDYKRNIVEDENASEPVEINFISEEEVVDQSALDSNLVFALRPLTPYAFSTEEAHFSATPRVEIISREKNKIEFEVPIEVSSVLITTKHNNEDIDVQYLVVG